MRWLRRRWQRMCAAIGLVVGILSGTGYDLGSISVFLPPSWKVPVLVGGLGLFILFQLLQPTKEKKAEAQAIHHFHHYVK